jgi:hypothetical protein
MTIAEKQPLDAPGNQPQKEKHVNFSRSALAALAAAGLGLTAAAAPPPAPRSQGPISDFLRHRAAVPSAAPPRVVKVRGDEETITMTHRQVVFVATTQAATVERDGKTVTELRTVIVPQVQLTEAKVAVKDCKLFRVSKDGKLEAIDPGKAAARWKKPTDVLYGTGADVDPRFLELVKPGTLYLALPEVMPMPEEAPVPLPPPKGERLKD